ncbi:unnamed protein product [Rotaria sp. Silwood2]|nr:unnamed protein product [Rotaria sp. Silwood2]CAF4400577.1 unnamed protein product [Rotaria sp. Silwood2]
MDTDELIARNTSSTTCAPDQRLNIKFESEEGGVSSDSESSINNEVDETEQLFNQKKAKSLLNDVFSVLGISPVSDIRNTNILQQKVTTAIELIWRAADDILKTPKTTLKDFTTSTITVDDTKQLLDGLKLLFKSSDYDEQIRLLTLAPSNWGRLQIQDFFACNQWQAHKALLLRSSYGHLARVTNFDGNQSMDPRLIHEIKRFYEDDGISRKDNLPSKYLEGLLNNQVSRFDEVFWMTWCPSQSSTQNGGENDNAKSTNKKIALQRIEGSVDDLFEEIDLQWHNFLKHRFTTDQQFEYIKLIKQEASEQNSIVIQMDFSENHNLLIQHQVMQAYWTAAQAAIFTADVTVSKDKHHSIAIISDYLSHDVQFVHAAQGVIVDYLRGLHPSVKHFNYVSDGAGQHFKNNKSLLNLTYHQSDFGSPASWTFSSTAHGKGPMDGIGATIKYQATRKVLSGKDEDAILTPEQLYKFAQQDLKIKVFYMDKTTIQQNTDCYKLLNR